MTNGQPAHLHQIAGNGLALATFLGILAGIGAGGVNEGDDGPAKFFGLLHQAQRFAVALGPGHTEIVFKILFQAAALAVPQNSHRRAMIPGNAAQNGGVLPALAVAPLLKEIREQRLDELIDMGPVGVAGQKNPVLGGQRLAAFHKRGAPGFQLGQTGSVGGAPVLLKPVFRPVHRTGLQHGDLGFQCIQFLEGILNQLCFLPWVCSWSSRASVSRILSRGTT